jgi:hypothetical protein
MTSETDEWPIERQARILGEAALRIKELGAALLWLRNAYDVGPRRLKPQTLTVIDKVLMGPDGVNTWVTIADQRAFREKYLKRAEVEVGQMFMEGRRGGSFNAPLVETRDLTKEKP